MYDPKVFLYNSKKYLFRNVLLKLVRQLNFTMKFMWYRFYVL